ncbi:MAG: helix-turn-helix domain-containing protein [Pseudomonadota bacterium]
MTQRKDLDAAEIDTIVGDRIRRRRILLGFTQDQLGEALGISYQQIQKYETGANRVSAGRLFQIAERLQTNVGWFFEGVGEQHAESSEDTAEMSSPRHVIELVRGYSRITEDRMRMAVLSLVRAMADAPSSDESANGGLSHQASASNGSAGDPLQS